MKLKNVIKATLPRLWRLTRTTSIVVGLAVMGALFVGVVSLAVAKPPEDGTSPTRTLLLGMDNAVSQLTSVTGQLGEPILRLVNNGEGPALALQAKGGQPPMTVNENAGTATNLSADKVDGKEPTDFGVTTKTNDDNAFDCTEPQAWNECAPVTVNVPPGKQYSVTVFSSFSVQYNGAASPSLFYCPAIDEEGGSSVFGCLGANGTDPGYESSYIRLISPAYESAASSGEINALPTGTYTFSTYLSPDDLLADASSSHVRTTVLVRDASVPGPPIE